jgi:hypothetical protein
MLRTEIRIQGDEACGEKQKCLPSISILSLLLAAASPAL